MKSLTRKERGVKRQNSAPLDKILDENLNLRIYILSIY